MSTFKPNNQTYSIYAFYGNLRTYTTWRILRFKCHLKRKVCHVVLCTNTVIGSLSFAFAGTANGRVVFVGRIFA